MTAGAIRSVLRRGAVAAAIVATCGLGAGASPAAAAIVPNMYQWTCTIWAPWHCRMVQTNGTYVSGLPSYVIPGTRWVGYWV